MCCAHVQERRIRWGVVMFICGMGHHYAVVVVIYAMQQQQQWWWMSERMNEVSSVKLKGKGGQVIDNW